MKRVIILCDLSVMCITLSQAQASVQYTQVQLAPRYTAVQLTEMHLVDDSLRAMHILSKPVNEAKQIDQEPNWDAISKSILNTTIVVSPHTAGEHIVKPNAVDADRNITRAKIYYYYGSNWPVFCSALIHYTEAFEDHTDAELMNKNAKMILENSTNPIDLKAAANWVKNFSAYKDTYVALLSRAKQ